MRGEHDHFGGGDGFENLARGFQTVEPRHGDIHQHHGGAKLFNQGNGLATVGRFASLLKVMQVDNFAAVATAAVRDAENGVAFCERVLAQTGIRVSILSGREEARYAALGVVAANPAVSGIHLMPFIQEAQKRGAKLAVIDPRRTKLARRSDLHVAPHPGTDLPLALAVVNLLFENGWADEAFLDEHTDGADTLSARVVQAIPSPKHWR